MKTPKTKRIRLRITESDASAKMLLRIIDKRIRKALAEHKVDCHHYTKDSA